MIDSPDRLSATVPDDAMGRRLDQILADLFPDFSRSRLQHWNDMGLVTVDGSVRKSKDKLLGGEKIVVNVVREIETDAPAQDIPLDVIFKDRSLIVVNKPRGLVVHPAAGNRDGTLQNALLHHFPELATVPRAGIVHRLDKDTTGLLVVARNLEAHTALVELLQQRAITREYWAVVVGVMPSGGTVNQPIDRHPVDRKRMAIREDGREAITHYRVIDRYRGHSLVKVNLETGRTHQIRVHMAAIRYPLVGDAVYGGRLKMPAGASPELQTALREFDRQALHARRLELEHPKSGKPMAWEAPIPDDMQALIHVLGDDVNYSDDSPH